MLSGRVLSSGNLPITGRPTVELEVSNITDPSAPLMVRATVDTGFTGHLTLPTHIIQHLGLVSRGTQRAELADGTMTELEVYPTFAWLDGHPRIVTTLESDSTPLLGMAFIWGSRLTVDAWQGGEVLIEELSDTDTA